VPGRGIPVLDVDQLEPRAFALQDLECPDMQTRSFRSLALGRFADEGRLGPFLEHDERMTEIDTTLMR
jgi:hypothetical protein